MSEETDIRRTNIESLKLIQGQCSQAQTILWGVMLANATAFAFTITHPWWIVFDGYCAMSFAFTWLLHEQKQYVFSIADSIEKCDVTGFPVVNEKQFRLVARHLKHLWRMACGSFWLSNLYLGLWLLLAMVKVMR